ncbi:MAG TPA: hypothetical protein VER79_05895, partial [Candidatus Limnocylindrales bacterium]|nr:hypothetical protein [Candidatus Limnocylindrales bacterium]
EIVQNDPITVGFSLVDPNTPDSVLYSIPDFAVGENDSDLMVITDQRTATGDLRMVLTPFRSSALVPFGSPQQMGYSLLTTFMLPFQAVGLLLLAALIGVIVLSQRLRVARVRPQGRRVVSRPLTSVITAQVGHDVTGAEAPAQLPEAADAAEVAGD